MEITAQVIRENWANKNLAESLPVAPQSNDWWDCASEAREFAKASHHGQVRKGTEEPYFLHLAEVAMIMGHFAELGLLAPEELKLALSVAWLHDTVEDCGVTLTEISAKFGKDVASCVDAMTKRARSEDVMDPMGDSLERIVALGKIPCLGKASDRISNLSWTPPPAWPSRQTRRYGQEGRHIAAALCGHLPHEAGLALELVADAYLKTFGALGNAAPKGP